MNNLVSLCKNYLKTKMEFANMEVMDIERICRTCLCASDLPLESINTEDDCEKINYAAMMKETFGKNLVKSKRKVPVSFSLMKLYGILDFTSRWSEL